MTKRYWNIHLEEMIQARVYLGHMTKRWNPKISPYIIAKDKQPRNTIHMTNLAKTARFLSEACDLLFDAASEGQNILIVGTQKLPQRTAELVALAAKRARCHYVSKKWFRGMLTNWVVTYLKLVKLKNLKISQSTGKFKSLPKRDAAILKRKLSTLQKYLSGIKYMKYLPDIVIIIDQKKEYLAVQECITLGIPTICLIDTNCDPDLADIPIPANDQDPISIRWILNKLVFAISKGHQKKIEENRSVPISKSRIQKDKKVKKGKTPISSSRIQKDKKVKKGKTLVSSKKKRRTTYERKQQ